jgi:YVTN family beta-propeller protein
MGYAQYVGRVGALAVALGIGVAVANGGVASATTDPDADPGAAQGGEQNPDTPTVGDPGTDTPQNPYGPETPPVGINGVEQNGNEAATTHRRVKPRVMILDILRGANLLGARGAADQDDGGTVAKLTAPTGSDPGRQVVAVPRALQRTIAAIAVPPKPKIAPSTKVLPGPIKPAAGVDNLATLTQLQAATTTGPSTLDAPTPAPPQSRPSPTRIILSLLSSVGLRPENFPPSSPLAPIGRLLEFVYAGLRRVDHQLFNQAPTGTALTSGEDPVTHEQLGTDPKTGVVTGRIVGVDPDDALVYTIADPPTTGSVDVNPDGSFTYTPDYGKAYMPGATETFTILVSEASTDHLHLSGGEHTVAVPVTVNLAPHNVVIATVPSRGTFPEDVVVHPDGTRYYVIYSNDSKVSVFEADGTFVKDIRVGKNPTVVANPVRMAISADGKTGYVGNFSDPSVSVVNLETNTQTGTFNVPAGVWDLAVLPNGKLYVAGTSGVAVVDPSNPAAQTLIPLTGNKGDIALSPDGKLAYVAIFGESRVAVINTQTNTVVGSIPVEGFVQDVQVNPVNGTIYVGDDDVAVIPAGSTTATHIEVPDSRGLAVTPDGRYLYVANINFDSVSIIDTSTNAVVGEIPITGLANASGPWRVAISPDGSRAYVVSSAGGEVSVIALLKPATVA